MFFPADLILLERVLLLFERLHFCFYPPIGYRFLITGICKGLETEVILQGYLPEFPAKREHLCFY